MYGGSETSPKGPLGIITEWYNDGGGGLLVQQTC